MLENYKPPEIIFYLVFLDGCGRGISHQLGQAQNTHVWKIDAQDGFTVLIHGFGFNLLDTGFIRTKGIDHDCFIAHIPRLKHGDGAHEHKRSFPSKTRPHSSVVLKWSSSMVE